MLDRKVVRPRSRGLPESLRQRPIGEKTSDVRAQCRGVRDRREKASAAVVDHLGNATGARRGNRLTEEQRRMVLDRMIADYLSGRYALAADVGINTLKGTTSIR